MSEDKRKRRANWLPSEKELLLNLVEFHYSIVENKKTDGVSVKTKLAQWQIIADKYNSRTTHCSRTGENLKAQWESMKKVARKDAANNRKHIIQTGGGSPLPPTKDDPFLQRILSLISTSAVGIFNPYDGDSIVPAVQEQDQAAIVAVETEDFPEPPLIQYEDNSRPVQPILIVKDQRSDKDIIETQQLVTKDWGDYTPQMLRTPVSLALKFENENQTPSNNKKRTGVSRRRPTHTIASSSLEQLHRKKIETIEFQKKLAVEEMERSMLSHDLDIKIKKEILRQEKIKTNILLIRRRKLLAFKKSTRF